MSAPKPAEPEPTNQTAKWWLTIFLMVCAVLCAVGVAVVMLRQKPADQGQNYAIAKLHAGDKTYDLQVADTPAKNELGLGGRENLGPRAGMLFTYPEEQTPGGICFWMKDMRFSIDIIWLDGQKKITHIEPSLSPATYPKTYCPPKASQYVVELNAGTAQKLDWQVGTSLDFSR